MYYYIICNGVYFHEKGKVILFEDIQEAQGFANMFFKYAMAAAAQAGGLVALPQVLFARSETEIREWNDSNSGNMMTKAFSEIKKERNI